MRNQRKLPPLLPMHTQQCKFLSERLRESRLPLARGASFMQHLREICTSEHIANGLNTANERGWSSNGHPSNPKEGAWRFTWRGHAPPFAHLSRGEQDGSGCKDLGQPLPKCRNALRAAAIASAAMGSPWSGKYACGIQGGWGNGNFKPLRIGLGGFQQYM